ncbi:MAG: short-chain dehydrogenase/reductase [Labilithrix sp.]|nr:short-chain dehydrogenase/reductase [Labilithrix sp.]
MDKVIAITGASSGIGAATAKLLIERGATVLVGARRKDRLEALGAAAFMAVDVTRRADLSSFVALALERFGRLDVLVNNAGIARTGPLDDCKVDEWDAMIDVNLRGPLHGIAAALPVFRKQGFGHIVNVLSVSGLRIVPNQGVYAGTKNAMRAISECLRQEAGDRLRVTIVSPGYVKTDLADHITNVEVRKQIVADMERLAIGPDAIARAIAFAIEQPADVDVGDIVVRPTAQS